MPFVFLRRLDRRRIHGGVLRRVCLGEESLEIVEMLGSHLAVCKHTMTTFPLDEEASCLGFACKLTLCQSLLLCLFRTPGCMSLPP